MFSTEQVLYRTCSLQNVLSTSRHDTCVLKIHMFRSKVRQTPAWKEEVVVVVCASALLFSERGEKEERVFGSGLSTGVGRGILYRMYTVTNNVNMQKEPRTKGPRERERERKRKKKRKRTEKRKRKRKKASLSLPESPDTPGPEHCCSESWVESGSGPGPGHYLTTATTTTTTIITISARALTRTRN